MSEVLTIYVELDALLDTRLATLHRIDPELAKRVWREEAYYHRQEDVFTQWEGPDKTTFREHYDRRDVDTLKHSTITQITSVLGEVVSKLEDRYLLNPTGKPPTVELNTWPYRLTEEQRILFINAVMYYSGTQTPVRTVWFAPEQLTMTLLRKRYAFMFMYDFAYWAQRHYESFPKDPLPALTMFAPSIFLDGVPTPEMLTEFGIRADASPTRLVEVAMAEFLGLDLMPTYFFSLLRPDRMQEWGDQYFREIQERDTNVQTPDLQEIFAQAKPTSADQN